MDVLATIYDTLTADQEIASQATGKIKYFEFPDSMTMDAGPYIIIEPLDVPNPSVFGDDKYIMYDTLIQIETWSKTRSLTNEIAERIESLLWGAGFLQTGGVTEYDSDIFRDARRYRKTIYSDAFILRELESRDNLGINSVSWSSVGAMLNKIVSLAAIINQETQVSIISETAAEPVLLSVFVQANTKATGIIGDFTLLSGGILSNSFMNARLERDRIANFITGSQTKISGTFEVLGKIDLTGFISGETGSQATLIITGNKRLAAVVLAESSGSAALEIQSRENLAAETLINTSVSMSMEVRSFKNLVGAIASDSVSHAEIEVTTSAAVTKIPTRYVRNDLNGNTVNPQNHWIEFQVYRGTTNLMLGRTPMNSGYATNQNLITDGSSAKSTAYSVTIPGYVQYDLGQVYDDLDYIKLWHFYGDGRAYHGNRLSISADGETWTTIFDSDIDGEYVELIEGHTFEIPYQ